MVFDGSCIFDKQYPKNKRLVQFYMNPKHPEKYYKVSFGTDCAPGPCTIFGRVEFF